MGRVIFWDVVISNKDIINSVFCYSWFQFAHVPYLLWKQARLVLTQSHRIHSAEEYMLVSGMEEAVLIYMEAIKNLLEI